MRPIDADALIEFCAERWIPLNIDAVNMQPTIQPEKTQLSQEGTTSDLISRRAAIDIERNATVDTNPSHFEAHQKFTQFMDDAEISSFGRWQWSNGFNTALTAVGIDLKKLPPARPEPTDINAKEAVYNLAEKIGIHQLFALTVELRGEPIQPEPQWIPVSERLPEDFTDVLVWFEYFRYGDYNCLYQTHGIGTYVANYNLWTVNHETGWKDLRVIAWMPLPEPYKPNKKQSGKEGA